MQILETAGWEDYELLDSGVGKRFERFGQYRVVRPDPQCIWSPFLSLGEWEKADAIFQRGADGREQWSRRTDVPHKWLLKYKGLSFNAKLSPFKHTGVFPEQHLMWDWLAEQLTNNQQQATKSEVQSANDQRPTTNDLPAGRQGQINVLNLFGYTGIASLACASAGAKVTHVDASYPTIGWAKENQEVSGLAEKPIRWILDDCLKFVTREVKRGVRYDGIIMDPPVFGHGPEGERWEFFESFPLLLKQCREVLSETPQFFLINAYAISASSIMLGNVLTDTMKSFDGDVESGELVLKQKQGNRQLSTGIYARWHAV
jgi:23S rRNA (cytosine1962-C5)-methyltransferase